MRTWRHFHEDEPVLLAVDSSPDISYFLSFLVERRRRYNINYRIKELGTLIPKSNDP